jgi:cytochrome c556
MRKIIVGLTLSLLAGGAAAQDVIAQRREGLKRMGAHAEAFKAVADRGGDPRGEVARVDDMLVWFRGMPALFPAGSGTGDTKARPEIWSDRAGFEQANTNALGRIEALRVAAAAGDAAGFQREFGALGPQGCGGCHRNFRAR